MTSREFPTSNAVWWFLPNVTSDILGVDGACLGVGWASVTWPKSANKHTPWSSLRHTFSPLYLTITNTCNTKCFSAELFSYIIFKMSALSLSTIEQEFVWVTLVQDVCHIFSLTQSETAIATVCYFIPGTINMLKKKILVGKRDKMKTIWIFFWK